MQHLQERLEDIWYSNWLQYPLVGLGFIAKWAIPVGLLLLIILALFGGLPDRVRDCWDGVDWAC